MNVEEVFLAALDLPDEDARSRFLADSCGGDAALRKEVDALLAAHFRDGAFLDVPAVEQVQSANPPEDEGEPLHFLAPSTRPDSLGRICHYEVLQVLGRGGFGIVFRAFDEILQRVVAIKVLAPAIAGTSPARKRFLREARSSAAVRHENVVQIHAVEEKPLPYLVMEFIPGENLQDRLNRTGPLDVAEVLRVGRQIAEGLAAAHASGLIHRDIKPGNILLEAGTQKVKITDFGLARAADDASLSHSVVVAGTPMYMAPEQALGRTLDQRANLFSLGSVLYQMVSGRPPFRADSTLAVMKRVAEDTPRPIRDIIPEAPRWLCDIIAKLHAKDPAGRFQSARELADMLAECEGRLKEGGKLSDFPRVTAMPPPRNPRLRWIATALMVLPPFVLAMIGLARWINAPREIVGEQSASGPTKAVSNSPKGEPDTDARRFTRLVEELKKRNPGFNGMVAPTFEGDAIVGLSIVTEHVEDITPLRELKRLRRLNLACPDSHVGGKLVDLSPLKGLELTDLVIENNRSLANLEPLRGMSLTRLRADASAISDLAPLAGMPLTELSLWCWRGSDLTPLKGMPLKWMNIGGNDKEMDLTPIAGAPLEFLCLNISKVSDIAPLKGMPLVTFFCENTLVSDLSPLRGAPLKELVVWRSRIADHSPVKDLGLTWFNLDFVPERDTAIVQGIKSLTRINDLPATEFWKTAGK